MPKVTLTLPNPHKAQCRVIDQATRFNVVDCGRRWGKTTLGIDRIATPETLPYPVGWFSPTYKMLLEVWRETDRLLNPIIRRRNTQERRLEFISGGLVEFWSLENPDSIRGRKYRRVIIDEAAIVSGLMDTWQYVIRPTLVDYEGDGWILSTPKGRNGFWQMYQWGLDPALSDWVSWQMPTSANPHIPLSEIEEMRLTMPERVFQQEILAEFLDDAGGVFRGVMAAATAEPQEQGREGASYIFGVDWGKYSDFTVIAVIEANSRSVVHLDRFNQIDYQVQVGRLKALAEKFRPTLVVAESNSMGDPIIETLTRDGLPIVPFRTTNATKSTAVDALVLAFERGHIKIIPDPILIGELQAYEMSRTPSGMLRYSAPDGMHDDCVMAVMLAWQVIYEVERPVQPGVYVYDNEVAISPY